MAEPCVPNLPRWNRADWIWLTLCGMIVVCFRVHAFPAPLENDECNYAYFAQRLLAGDRLYVDLWDHQPPGVYALLVPPTALFGSAPTVYRTLALAVTLPTLLGVFALSRRWFGRVGAWSAAILFALAGSDPGIGGEGCNREIYMNVLLVAAVWLLARSENAPRYRAVLAAGLLLGLASTIKTVVAVHWVALLPAVLLPTRRAVPAWGRPVFKAVLAFAAGPAIVWLAVWSYFAADGRSGAFLDATFLYNLVYSETDAGWGRRLIAFFFEGDKFRSSVFGTARALWLAALVGVFALPWRRARLSALLLGGWLAGSYLAVCLPGRFWPHYYLLMLPPAVLLAAALVRRIEGRRPQLAFVAVPVIAMALLATQVSGYLLTPPERLGWNRYGPRMTWARDMAARVAAVTDPTDTIYVWSIDANFYYYSGRRCASRFTMYGPLIADAPSTAARRRLLLEDLARNPPRLILLLAKPPFAELHQFFLDQRYVSVGRTKQMEVLCKLERPIALIDWSWEPP